MSYTYAEFSSEQKRSNKNLALAKQVRESVWKPEMFGSQIVMGVVDRVGEWKSRVKDEHS